MGKFVFLILFFGFLIYLKLAFWGTVIMSAAKPVSQSCGVEWKLEKLPLFTGNWFCP